MTTTADTILTAAINADLAIDASVPIADDTTEQLGELSRLVRRIYTLAAIPKKAGGWREGNYFTSTSTVSLATPATTFVSLPATPECAWIIRITTAGGTAVNLASLDDLRKNRAEYPPAIVLEGKQIRSAGRTGDPVAGAVLTVDYSYVPPALTATTDYIGATTPSDSSTTAWPGYAGDGYLIAAMTRYFVEKSGDADAGTLQRLDAKLAEQANILGPVVGIGPVALAAVLEQ